MKPRIAVLAVVLLALAVSCSSRGEIVVLSPSCKETNNPTRVSCPEAVLVAQAVARASHVSTSGPTAEVKSEGVAEGKSVPAWWVTFRSAVYHAPSGDPCVPRSYSVIVDGATGQLLAWDVPPFPGC